MATPAGEMKLLYSLVARERVVLAEFTDQSGNFPTVTRVLLNKIDSNTSGRVSYRYDAFMFHWLIDDGMTYLCMTSVDDADSGRVRMPFAFLDEIKGQFIGTFGERAKTAIAFEMNKHFSMVLEDRMKHYNETGGLHTATFAPASGKVGEVQSKLDQVKGVMVQNIDHILERGEKLELLVDKTDALQTQAFEFQSTSRKLRQKMYWRKIKMYIAFGVCGVVAVWLISSFICGFAYEKCRDDHKH